MPEPISTETLFAKFQGSFDKSAASLARRLRTFGSWVKACEWLNTPNEFLHGMLPAEFAMKEDYLRVISALNAR